MEAVFRSFLDIKRIRRRAVDRSQRQFLKLKRLERNHPSNISLSSLLLRMHNKKPTREGFGDTKSKLRTRRHSPCAGESLDRATKAKTPKVQLLPEESQIPQGACWASETHSKREVGDIKSELGRKREENKDGRI